MITKNKIPIICLPPSDNTIHVSSPRLEIQQKMLPVWKERAQVIIVGLLEEGKDISNLIQLYNMMKETCLTNPNYLLILLINSKEVATQLFPLPNNMIIYRLLHLSTLLPYCDIALTNGDLNTFIETIHANLASLAYITEKSSIQRKYAIRYAELGLGMYVETPKITPQIFEKQITQILKNRKEIEDKSEKIKKSFDSQNKELEKIISKLINIIQQN